MARITICDLCKQRISDESEPNKLTLSFYANAPQETEDAGPDHILDAELCEKCTGVLRNRIESPDALTIAPAPQNPIYVAGDLRVEDAISTLPGPATNAVGPSEEDKANRTPTEDLLEDEIHKVPSSVDLRKGSKGVRDLNRKIVKDKGPCAHHYKSFEEGTVMCADAPPDIRGPYANFKGCGKSLMDDEL